MPDKYERFVVAYLRLNGYFTVPNFVVHAGDDQSRISSGYVGNYSEVDTLGVRMPHSREVTGPLHIGNHDLLTDGGAGKVDVVVAEVKAGNDNTPNKIWREGAPDPAISYVVRFIGERTEAEAAQIAQGLATTFRFEDVRCRYRYVVFSKEPNDYYAGKGVTYITFRKAIEFIVEIRGQSWVGAAIGTRSIHQQWDEMLIDIFNFANNHERSLKERTEDIERFLAT